MKLQHINPTETKAWQKLKSHFSETEQLSIQDLFQNDAKRAEKFNIEWDEFYVDFSKNNWTEETIQLLIELANEVGLPDAISKYFSGEKINETEDRAVLHTALRANENDVVLFEGKNVIPEIYDTKNKIKDFTNYIVSGEAKGYSGKPFTDVVNIGIGGSDLGPAMIVEALQFYKNNLNTHFISNVDGDHVQEILKKINPETTLFVIVSKTFTTQETLTNSETVKKWFLQHATEKDIAKHFVAVSTNLKNVTNFGIAPENIFPMWD
jgi:glucose-6-phosphate isomerase